MMRRVLPLVLLCATFALRVIGLGRQELRGDEAFGYFFSLSTPVEIVALTLELAEPHPVASYWLQHGWLILAGHSEFALRFPSAWWSVLAVALLLALARRLDLPTTSGLAAGLPAAVSPYLIWHAQDARMYSMSLTLTTASTLAAVAWWTRPDLRRSAVYVLTALLALHTHYYAAYVIFAHMVAIGLLALVSKRHGRAVQFGLPLLALGLLFLPWLIAANHILTGYMGNGDSPGLLDAVVRAHAALLTGDTTPLGWRWLPALLLLAAAGCGTAFVASTRPMSFIWLATTWLVPLGLTWVSAQARPIFDERYLVAIAPPVYLLAAATVDIHTWRSRLLRWLWAFCLVAMVVGLVRSWTLPAYSKDRGWRELAQRLTELTAGVDPTTARLIQNYPDPTLWYYYTGPVPHLVLPPQANNLDAAQREVERLVANGVARVVLIEQPAANWDSDAIAQAALRDAFTHIGDTQVVAQSPTEHAQRSALWPLSLYTRPTGPLAPIEATFVNGVALTGAAVEPSALPAAGWLTAHLAWQGSDERTGTGPSTRTVAVSLQLLDAAGQLVAQQDQPLPLLPTDAAIDAATDAATVVDYGILLPRSLAPGTYTLTVLIYDPGQANALRIPLQAGGERVVLATVHVAE